MFLSYLICLLCLLHVVTRSAGDVLTLSPPQGSHVKYVGDRFFVSCTAKGKTIHRVMWNGPDKKQIINYQGSEVRSSDKERIHVDAGTSGLKGVDLYNTDVEMKDRGNYTCSASVDGKEVQKSFELLVFKTADFKATPKEQYLEEGNNSTLKCNVEGDPVPTVTWQKERKDVKYKDGKYMRHPDNKDWLIIINATISDAGVYTCKTLQVNKKMSDMKRLSITVDVHHKPFGPGKHSNESFSFVSGVVNLTCEAVAEPKANFTWLKNGLPLNVSDTLQIFDEAHKSVLEISVEDDSMFGDYYCKAQNSLGTLERVVTLEKGRKPAIPHTEVNELGSEHFKLKINSQNHPEMPILSYKIEYKRPGDDWTTAKYQEFKAGGQYILRNLKVDTLYVIRGSAQNVAGFSDTSPEIMKRTQKENVSQATLASISISSILILITIPLVYNSYSLDARPLIGV